MSRIFLWFFSLYAVILLQICLKKKTQRLRHFTLVWCSLTLNGTHLYHSVWLDKPVVLNPCRGFLYMAKVQKNACKVLYSASLTLSWCYSTLTWCNVLITPGWCRVNITMVYNYTALSVTVTSSLFPCGARVGLGCGPNKKLKKKDKEKLSKLKGYDLLHKATQFFFFCWSA